ncbi:hypothetical protein [Nitrosophilus labii]|uniref:hypothetical protein n=1 Tax=Nitrosophilus labii TaxID=2706014 RepID=UPI001657020A|nr:hypothetical protein [Nitrosophilus labii]
MTVLDLLNEVSRSYDVDSFTIMKILKETIKEDLNLGELIDSFDGKNYTIYELYVNKDGSRKKRKVHITQNRLLKIRDKFYKNMIDAYVRDKIKTIKNDIGKDKVIRGKIIDTTDKGLLVFTKYGNAFAPKNLLNPKELNDGKYTKETELYFHVHKLSKKKGRVNIVLDRVSKKLTEYIIREIIGNDYRIYAIERKFGYRTKIYIGKMPSKQEIELVRLSLGEKVIFKQL